MFNKISFVNLILDGLLLRILFVFIGTFLSIKIIGVKNIFFLKDYINRSFFQKNKIMYWSISLLSLLYFEHLIANAEYQLSVATTFNKNYLLSFLVLVLLIAVILNAFIYMIASIEEAKKSRQEINKAYKGKSIINFLSLTSLFIPTGLLAKGLFFGGIYLFDTYYVDKQIESTLSIKIKRTINTMLLIVLINLFIIIGTYYLVNNQIVFW